MTNSKQKGKRGELEVAALFRAHGFEARRGQQFKGTADSPDVIHDIPNLHVEVKFKEKFSLYNAMDQASSEASYPKIPTVFYRRKHKPWVAVLLADDFLRMLEELKRFNDRILGKSDEARKCRNKL